MEVHPCQDRFEYIDSSRGIAILMVVFVHTSQSIKGLNPHTIDLTEFCQLGVQLFFVLSAVTMCNSLEKVNLGKKNILLFYLKRFFRIAPLYYAGIIIYFSISLLLNYRDSGILKADEQYNPLNIISNVVFVHGFYRPANNNIVPGGWSIGTEMVFYLMVPFLFLFYKHLKNKVIFLIIPFLFLVSNLVIFNMVNERLLLNKDQIIFIYYNLFNQLPVFLIGISYFFYFRTYENKQPGNFKWMTVSIFVFIFSLFAMAKIRYNISLTPVLSAVSFVFLIEVFRNCHFLINRVLVRIGQLSYSIYIFHFIFAWYISGQVYKMMKEYVFPELGLVICFLISVFLTSMVAMASEKAIEKPGIDFGRKISSYFFQR
jgi:peptidoglycan/LPS O-acetylase OafA/YrhL